MAVPFIIGGGELAQQIWFDLQMQGVKSPTALNGVISIIGSNIDKNEKQLQPVFQQAVNDGVFKTVSEENTIALFEVFKNAFVTIRQFLYTNVPAAQGAKQVNLGYQGGSITFMAAQ